MLSGMQYRSYQHQTILQSAEHHILVLTTWPALGGLQAAGKRRVSLVLFGVCIYLDALVQDLYWFRWSVMGESVFV